MQLIYGHRLALVAACALTLFAASGCGGEIGATDPGDGGAAEWGPTPPSGDGQPADATVSTDRVPVADRGPAPDRDAPAVDVRPDPPAKDAAPAPDARWDCTPGAKQTEPCGACDTGKRTRACSAAGTWPAWSACSGAQTGFPYHPTTKQLVCPPYSWPAVFIAPHPDDETIFMAGAIREHLNAGRHVFVELMTHGEASGARPTLANGGTCSWHSGTHSYSLSARDFGNARVAEFRDASARLGVTGVYVSDFGDKNLSVAEVASRIAFWLQHQDPAKGISLKGTRSTTSSSYTHPDHIAVWSALLACGHWDLRGYAPAGDVPPAATLTLSSALCAAKNNAWGAYQRWDPAAGRYAIGRHSVGYATMDCHEYLVKP